jgi:uncharacterized protein (DUF58 family)
MGIAAALAVVLPAGMAVGLFGVVVAAVATDAWMARAVPHVEVATPPILSRGVPAALRVRVSPPLRTRVRVPGTPDVVLEPDEGDGGITGTITARRRGTHVLARPATVAEGPLGLGRWYHRAGDEVTVVVYPDMPQARRIATEVRLGRFGETARRTRGPLGLGTELESIRDYLPDDDVRQVNWKATARMGSPMSNTYRIDQEREVVILVDTGRLMAAPVDAERTRLDVAVDAAAALASVADVLGDRVGVVAFDARIRRRTRPRRDGADVVVRAIHDLEPTDVESSYDLAFRIVAGAKRAFVLILSDLMEETAARPLVDAMPILARHHAVTVAGVADPQVAASLSTPAASPERAMVTAVAVDVERSRRAAAATLAGYGAEVVDAAPDDLARRCVASYLRAKRRARL